MYALMTHKTHYLLLTIMYLKSSLSRKYPLPLDYHQTWCYYVLCVRFHKPFAKRPTSKSMPYKTIAEDPKAGHKDWSLIKYIYNQKANIFIDLKTSGHECRIDSYSRVSLSISKSSTFIITKGRFFSLTSGGLVVGSHPHWKHRGSWLGYQAGHQVPCGKLACALLLCSLVNIRPQAFPVLRFLSWLLDQLGSEKKNALMRNKR